MLSRLTSWRCRVIATDVIMATLAAVLVACTKQTAVWIIAGSTTTSLTLGLGTHVGQEEAGAVDYVIVYRCAPAGSSQEPERMWTVGITNDSTGHAQMPGRLQYGQAPPGMVEDLSARPLRPGAYVAASDGSGSVSFWANADGTITPTSDRACGGSFMSPQLDSNDASAMQRWGNSSPRDQGPDI